MHFAKYPGQAGGQMEANKTGIYKKIMGSVCHLCPLCKYGRKNPRSVVGRILHHPLHADHCPMWKSEKMLYPDDADDLSPKQN